ncbi:MAG: hypothetical protein V4655_05950 [Bdellovibrionota bacterium]
MDQRQDEGLREGFPSDARALFLSKLGEKLAYDRAFLRLYEAYLEKRWGKGNDKGTIKTAEVGQFEFQEIVVTKRRQLDRLVNTIEAAGGSAQSLVPSRELSAIAQLGIVSVFTDPGCSLRCLVQAVRVIELAGRNAGLYLMRVAYASRETIFAKELQAMQDESELKILSLDALCRWSRTGKMKGRHLRALQLNLNSLH